jgi:tRNA threonylcarbamoyladenosine biosynthesis protein TsaE
MTAAVTIDTARAEELEAWGARLAGAYRGGGLVAYLSGELGAGKTTLVRGFLSGLGYVGIVKSPTYTLVEPYELRAGRVYHFDLYRIAGLAELEHIGFRDYLGGDALVFVEWPERGPLPRPWADLSVTINYHGDGRRVEITAHTPKGEGVLAACCQRLLDDC